MENQAKLEMTIDLSNKEQTKAFANLFLALAGQTSTAIVAEETSKKPLAKKTEKPAEVEKTAEIEKPAEVEKPAEASSDSKEEKIKIEDVRALLQQKVAKHRDAIKAELTKHGAANVTALNASKYSEFMTFLKALE